LSESLGMSTNELLYADNLVLMAETKDLLVEKVQKKKKSKKKGLRVNLGKKMVAKCEARRGPIESLGMWPCRVCRKCIS